MENKIRKKRKFNRFLTIITFLLIIVSAILYINKNILFKPFLSFKGDNRLVLLSKSWIDSNINTSFISIKTINSLNPNLIDQSIASLNPRKNFFLKWTIMIQKKINNRYILLNNQVRVLDEKFSLNDVIFDQEIIKKQFPFLIKIEILKTIPIFKSEDSKKKLEENINKKNQNEIINENYILTQQEICEIYEKNVKEFIQYLVQSESSLGPKISTIQFFQKEGLRLIIYDKTYWFGLNKEYRQMEENIQKCDVYLKKKNQNQSYNEFDLRYKNRIICRNNQ